MATGSYFSRSAAGQLSVLDCPAGNTGCGARCVHRLSVTSGTAVNTCRGGAACLHAVDSQSPGGDALGTGPSCATRRTGWLLSVSSRNWADPDGRQHSFETRTASTGNPAATRRTVEGRPTRQTDPAQARPGPGQPGQDVGQP
jgi:hypothetical protein